jgi:ketosteroid isomerase-like protein
MVRFTTTILILALAIGAFAIGAFAQAPADFASRKANLVALERLWNQVQVNRDAKAIAAMIGDRFVNTEFDGGVSKRGKFLADFADPKFKPSVMNIDNVEVEVYGTTAIVAGDYHTKGLYDGKAYEHFGRFTDTWVYGDGKWLCVASHSSLKK